MPQRCVSQEDGGERTPLRFAYDEVRDILTVEGIEISGDVFRTWQDPDPTVLYRFTRDEGGPLYLTQVESLDILEASLTCVMCGCTSSNACLQRDSDVPDAPIRGCGWAEFSPPVCTACAPETRHLRVRGPNTISTKRSPV